MRFLYNVHPNSTTPVILLWSVSWSIGFCVRCYLTEPEVLLFPYIVPGHGRSSSVFRPGIRFVFLVECSLKGPADWCIFPTDLMPWRSCIFSA